MIKDVTLNIYVNLLSLWLHYSRETGEYCFCCFLNNAVTWFAYHEIYTCAIDIHITKMKNNVLDLGNSKHWMIK